MGIHPEIPISSPETDAQQPVWLEKHSRSIALAFLLLTFVIAVSAMAGWLLDIPLLFEIVGGFASMKFNTALCFLLLGVAGVSYLGFYSQVTALIAALSLGAVYLISLITVVEYYAVANFGIDQLFVADRYTQSTYFPGRMSQATAVGLLLSAMSCTALYFNRVKTAQILAAVVAALGLLAILAYVFDRDAIYRFVPFSSLSLNTALALLCVGLAILFAETGKAYLRFLFLESTGGVLARRFAPFVLAVPFMITGFVWATELLFGFSTYFGVFLLSSGVAILLIFILRRFCNYIHELEQAKSKANLHEHLGSERLAQVQRIEAMGLVAGGIAHDFKNLLVPIRWSAEIGLESVQPGDDNAKRYRTVIESVDKAALLAERMLEIGKVKRSNFEFVDINQLLREFVDILKGIGKGGVNIELNLSQDIPEMIADKSQLEQVLINLTSNACFAMGNNGEMVVETTLCGVVTKQFEELSTVHGQTGEYVCLSVSDNGRGMSENERCRALEPFFSTKDAGVGHGLGLSSVHNIVLQHLGFIEVQSEQGEGTTIRIFFPVRIGTKAKHQLEIQLS